MKTCDLRPSPHNSDPEIVQCKGVSFSYSAGSAEKGLSTTLFENFTLTIAPGEYVCLIGANGSGKSTLALLIDGLIFPAQGQVIVKGSNTMDLEGLAKVRQTVGLMFQNPDDQMVATLVENEVAFGPENLNVDPKELEQRVNECLDYVHLTGLRQREIHQLSGGQRQRVALAGVLAMDPEVVVFDEATSHLDPAGRLSFSELCKKMQGQGTTILSITQNMAEALEASRLIVMNDGVIVADGDPVTILENRDLLFSLGLGSVDRYLLELESENGPLPAYASVTLPAETISDWVLELDSVNFTFQPEKKKHQFGKRSRKSDSSPDRPQMVLENVSFKARRGEIVGISGPSGSGKTTLLEIIAGLRKPTSGSVKLDGKSQTTNFDGRVGYLFQDSENQLFASSVYEDVAFGPQNLGLSQEETELRVNESLKAVGLEPDKFLERNPFHLSGGEKRRVALAGVIALDPEILILDEPAAGLDPRSRARLLYLVKQLAASGMTCLFASHEDEDIALICDRVLHLADGRVTETRP